MHDKSVQMFIDRPSIVAFSAGIHLIILNRLFLFYFFKQFYMLNSVRIPDQNTNTQARIRIHRDGSLNSVTIRFHIPLIVKVSSGAMHISCQICVSRKSILSPNSSSYEPPLRLATVIFKSNSGKLLTRKVLCSHYWVSGIALLGSPLETPSNDSGKCLFEAYRVTAAFNLISGEVRDGHGCSEGVLH